VSGPEPVGTPLGAWTAVSFDEVEDGPGDEDLDHRIDNLVLDGGDVLRQRTEDYLPDGDELAERIGVWPEGVRPSSTFYVLDHAEGPVTLALVEGAWAWAVPWTLGFGDFNDCPSADDHAAVHHHWAERYGAELTCLSSSVLELSVARLPRTREDALALALEQYAYAPDIVDQGTGTVSVLAARLLDARTRFFWWD
jgi:hypothetical protein